MNPLKLINLILMSLIVIGCASSQVKVSLQSGQELNQDANRQSLPVVARIYQLKDKTQFESATFNTLWKDDTQYLGQDLLSREEILIYPGDKKIIPLNRQEKAEYIAVVALFRDYKQGSWKSVVPERRKLKIQLENNELKIIK